MTKCPNKTPGWHCTIPEEDHNCTYPESDTTAPLGYNWVTARSACRPMPNWYNVRGWIWHLSRGRF